MQFLSALIGFMVTLGILVTIHEFGHFWVAKKLGVKVLRFSVGFGKVLKSWQRGETTYTLCALPLGGFVKMLDENEAKVASNEKHRAFNTQTVYTRIAIVIAGPAANFILAIVLYTFIFILGTNGIQPIVGVVTADSIAERAGLATGDKLLRINTQETPGINEFSMAFIHASKADTLQLHLLSKTAQLKTLTLNLTDDFLANPEQGVEHYLGFKFAMPLLKPRIDKVLAGSPAQLAGIQSGDEIVRVNGELMHTWQDFVTSIRQHDNQAIPLQVRRGQQTIGLLLTPKNADGTPKIGVSVKVPEDYLKQWRVLIKKQPVDAFLAASQKVGQLTLLNLMLIQKMILGETPINQISGPITIADYAGKTAQIGLVPFLAFLALISIGLGLLNLLPIPLLDGGHLFFYLIEIVKGSPVSQTIQQTAAKFGLLLIVALTFIALYNDFFRLLS